VYLPKVWRGSVAVDLPKIWRDQAVVDLPKVWRDAVVVVYLPKVMSRKRSVEKIIGRQRRYSKTHRTKRHCPAGEPFVGGVFFP